MDVREFKEIGLMVVILTFDFEIQGQTWRNTFNMISLVVYIVETCFGVYKY